MELSVVEQRYQAVVAVVQDGWRLVEVADRLGVSRQTVHTWIARNDLGGPARRPVGRLPGAGLEPSLHCDRDAFGEGLGRALGDGLPGHDVVELRDLGVVGREPEPGPPPFDGLYFRSGSVPSRRLLHRVVGPKAWLLLSRVPYMRP